MDTVEVYAPLRSRLWQVVIFFGALIAVAGVGLLAVWRQQRVRYYRAQAQAAEALRESEERFRVTLKNSSIIVAMVDRDLRYTWIYNPHPDFNPMTVIGKRDDELAQNDGVNRLVQLKEQVIETGVGMRAEIAFSLTDGILTYDITAEPLRDATGQVMGVITAAVDITERKRAEEALRASLAEKQVLLQEVYHRIKNNLTAIIGLINLHEAGAADPATAALLVELEGRIRSMALVHQSLYQARDLAHVNLQDYLETLIAQLRASLAPRPDVHCHVEAAGVEMGLDTAVPCGLIVNELITNAFKYAFPGGQPRPGEKACEITVSAEWGGGAGAPAGGDYTLVVADNGVGLPAGLDWAATKPLGLRLVRLLVQHQLAGHIEIDRASGTRFTLQFASRRRG